MTLKLYTVNAFADAPFTGNPAAVCPLEAWLDDALLQAIAAQNNLAETAFFVPSDDQTYHLRWFTPTTEVPLCGHATLATAFVLKELLHLPGPRYRFHSLSGPIAVDASDERYTLDFPAQAPRPASTPDWFLDAFSANPREFHTANYHLALFPSQSIVAALEPDFAAFRKIPQSNVIATAPGDAHDFVCRFFAPHDGIDEDPVTGSAFCILAPFWAKRLGKPDLSARQISARGGEVRCGIDGQRVRIAGRAQLYSSAEIYL